MQGTMTVAYRHMAKCSCNWYLLILRRQKQMASVVLVRITFSWLTRRIKSMTWLKFGNKLESVAWTKLTLAALVHNGHFRICF